MYPHHGAGRPSRHSAVIRSWSVVGSTSFGGHASANRSTASPIPRPMPFENASPSVNPKSTNDEASLSIAARALAMDWRSESLMGEGSPRSSRNDTIPGSGLDSGRLGPCGSGAICTSRRPNGICPPIGPSRPGDQWIVTESSLSPGMAVDGSSPAIARSPC
jgi:hypothetical protein